MLRPAHQRGVLAFLKQLARAYPRVPLHVVFDNYATHKHPNVQAWLAKHPRVQLHFTPTSGSWLNTAEVFFGIITKQAIRPRHPRGPAGIALPWRATRQPTRLLPTGRGDHPQASTGRTLAARGA